MEKITPEQKVESLFQLYQLYGANEYAGEKVSQLEHMAQAAQLAMEQGQDAELVLAAFFHDLGHLLPVKNEEETMAGYGVKDHESLGASYLASLGFSIRICRLISSHVNAKRYLTYKFPEYYASLSDASRKTLEYQGGKMDAREAGAFERDPLFDQFILMRRWDEAAKLENQPLPDIHLIKSMAIEHLRNQEIS
jgi:2-amino-1-hydroxyethylphosphonate dioxygenase (glycine-forming)